MASLLGVQAWGYVVNTPYPPLRGHIGSSFSRGPTAQPVVEKLDQRFVSGMPPANKTPEHEKS